MQTTHASHAQSANSTDQQNPGWQPFHLLPQILFSGKKSFENSHTGRGSWGFTRETSGQNSRNKVAS